MPDTSEQPAAPADTRWLWYYDAAGAEASEGAGGGFADRETAIKAGREAHEPGEHFKVFEALRENLNLAEFVDGENFKGLRDTIEDEWLFDHTGPSGTPVTEGVTERQWNALRDKLRAAFVAWQAEANVVLVSNVFADTRNEEFHTA